MFYIRNLSKGFDLKCSCIPIRHSKCHQQMWRKKRSLHYSTFIKLLQAASNLFNMIQLFVDVSQCFAGGSGCFYGQMAISSLAIASQETVAKVLSAALQPPVTELQVPCIAG